MWILAFQMYLLDFKLKCRQASLLRRNLITVQSASSPSGDPRPSVRPSVRAEMIRRAPIFSCRTFASESTWNPGIYRIRITSLALELYPVTVSFEPSPISPQANQAVKPTPGRPTNQSVRSRHFSILSDHRLGDLLLRLALPQSTPPLSFTIPSGFVPPFLTSGPCSDSRCTCLVMQFHRVPVYFL
jgi:hypothetical protein